MELQTIRRRSTYGKRRISPYGIPQPWGTRYSRHKAQAKHRREAYDLTAQEFYDCWVQSGRMHQCGNTKGDYSMRRIDFRLPWIRSNIEIVSRFYLAQRLGKRYWEKEYMVEEYMENS